MAQKKGKYDRICLSLTGENLKRFRDIQQQESLSQTALVSNLLTTYEREFGGTEIRLTDSDLKAIKDYSEEFGYPTINEFRELIKKRRSKVSE